MTGREFVHKLSTKQTAIENDWSVLNLKDLNGLELGLVTIFPVIRTPSKTAILRSLLCNLDVRKEIRSDWTRK